MIPEGVSQALPQNTPQQFTVQKPWINKVLSLPPCSNPDAWCAIPENSRPYRDLSGQKPRCCTFVMTSVPVRLILLGIYGKKVSKGFIIPVWKPIQRPVLLAEPRRASLRCQLKRGELFSPFPRSVILRLSMILFLWGNPDFIPLILPVTFSITHWLFAALLLCTLLI